MTVYVKPSLEVFCVSQSPTHPLLATSLHHSVYVRILPPFSAAADQVSIIFSEVTAVSEFCNIGIPGLFETNERLIFVTQNKLNNHLKNYTLALWLDAIF